MTATSRANEDENSIIDMREQMIRRLSDEVEVVQERQNELICAALELAESTHKVHAATLEILHATNFEEFLDILKTSCERYFDIHDALLVVGRDDVEEDLQPHPAMRVVPTETIVNYLDPQAHSENDNVTLRPIRQSLSSHAGKLENVGSEAILELSSGTGYARAIILLSSNERDRFTPELASDLLSFFAHVVELRLGHWLAES